MKLFFTLFAIISLLSSSLFAQKEINLETYNRILKPIMKNKNELKLFLKLKKLYICNVYKLNNYHNVRQ